MNTGRIPNSTLYWSALLFCFAFLPNSLLAQMPVCDLVYAKTYTGRGKDTIFSYNPALPVSASNPVPNTIRPLVPSFGLTVSPVLKSGSTTLTFYSVDFSGKYIYYDPSAATWVNTGHSTGFPVAVNIAAGGGYIYSLNGGTGDVYQYDGTRDGAFLTNVAGFALAGPYDLLADCEGNWYIFNQTDAKPFLRQYSSSGVLLRSWVYSNPLGLAVYSNAGFAIVGSTLYTDNNATDSMGKPVAGIATYHLGFDTLTLVSTQFAGRSLNDDLGSCAGSVLSMPDIEIAASEDHVCVGKTVSFSSRHLGAGGSPGYKWFVNGVLVSTGSSSYSYTPADGDVVTCVLISSSPCASVPTDTSNRIRISVHPPVTPPIVVSPVDYCRGDRAAALTATGTGLLWYTAATGGAGVPTAPVPATSAAGSTTYYVSQTISGCESIRVPLLVNVHTTPAPAVVSPVLYCVGSSAVPLTAAGSALLWYATAAGGTGSSTAPTPGTGVPGAVTYYVSQTSTLGCESSRAAIVVQTHDVPDVQIDSKAAPVFFYCKDDSITLKAVVLPYGIHFQWKRNGTDISGAVNDSLVVFEDAVYSVVVSNAPGCNDSAGVTVRQDTTLLAPVVSPTDVFICDGVHIMLYASPAVPGYGYEWSKDGVALGAGPTSSVVASAAGTYSVRVSDAIGCPFQSNYATVSVYSPVPRPVITKTGTTLSIPAGPYSYQWYRNNKPMTGAVASRLDLLYDGSYFVSITDKNGCTAYSDTLRIINLAVGEMQHDRDVPLLYPNPTTGTTYIASGMPVHIIVTDITGRRLLEQHRVTAIDLSSFSDGLYLVVISNDQGQTTGTVKLMKQSR